MAIMPITLSKKRVYVVGIGGVGSWVAESLARSGIGEIRLADLDDICVTNTNRQVHALSSTIGQSKIAVWQSGVDRSTLRSRFIVIMSLLRIKQWIH